MEQISKKITAKIEISPQIFAETQEKIKNISDFKKKIEEFLIKSVSEILEVILGGGIILRASDIHIEPEENQAKIRVRIDGILQDVMILDLKTSQTLLSRIKLLSGIKLNIADRPQDGRFSILMEKTEIEIRTSTLPAEYGESIVLRILNPKSLIEIEELGVRKDLLEIFKREIKRPNGMIIVTGPTGSGKTTTLYAFLKRIQNPEIKIITIEDPIEYHLKEISQTQVNPAKGYDFASGLKSIMRQDPDVVLVGEIRDLETAKISIQAALTGHLVLTTLHTNDAAGTVVRIEALGEKPVNIAPAINMAVAQRLVRKVCQKCAKFEKISLPDFEKIKKALKKIPKKIISPSNILEDRYSPALKIPQAKGCKDCNFTGYRGRIGIFEAFLVDDEMEKFILTSPSISALREKAIKKGMFTMHQDGIIKVLEGITTIKEVERATGE
ncbi:MAG: GspE/PulE family protein [bacterium]|nr:GspE/PulE family protein [bacterium]